MDRNNWFFRQRVTDSEMVQFNDFIEGSDFNLVTDLLGSGLLKGDKIFENSPTDDTNILVDQRISYDTFGRRVAIQDLFADTISSVVRGLTLQTDSIAVPSTVGTYILFTKQPSAAPFTLVGEKIVISRSKFPGNNGSFTIQQVVVTDWGGLIPSQIMVRIDEELDEDGYESGLSPRGTTSLARVNSTGQSLADVTKNEIGGDVKPVNPGNERIVSLYARFDRNEFDTRLDGNAQLVDFVSLQSFKFVIDDSQPEASIGNALTPALRTNGDVFLTDIRLEKGADILQADIDTSRQSLITTLPTAVLQLFELANAQVHGDKITWTGTNLSINADLKISIPNKSFLYTVPAFNQVLADGEILFVKIDRVAVGDPSPVHQVAARGSVPSGDEETLVLVIGDRRGTKLRGAYGGELQPNETRDIGDSIGEAYLSFSGQGNETTSIPTYVEAFLSAATSLQNADDILAAGLGVTNNVVNQDRNLKLIGGGTFGPPSLTGTPADEVQRLLFSAIPDGGSITLKFNNVNTAPIPAPFTPSDIANALNALAALSGVVGSGAMPTADMTFGTADGAKDQPLIKVAASSLVLGAAPVTVAISVLTQGAADIISFPFSEDAFVEVPGVEIARNTIQQSVQSPILFAANGTVAFVIINRTPGVNSNLVVQTGHIEDIDITNPNIFIFARRVNDEILIGEASGFGTIIVDFIDPVNTVLPTGATVTIDGVLGVDGDLVLFTNLITGNNKIYKLSGVGVSISWAIQSSFIEGATPIAGEAARAGRGDAFATFEAIFDGTDFKVNDIVRFFDGANFYEQSSLKTAILANNTTGSIFEVNVTGSENFIIGYSITRGSSKETGTIIITSDGVSANHNRIVANLADVGVSFNADVVTGDIRLRFTTDNSGPSSTMKYQVKRWSDSPGGPTGIPNYINAGAGAGGPAAGATGEVQFRGAGGNLDTDPKFKWDDTNKAIDLGGFMMGALIGPLVLNDNQAAPLTLVSELHANFKHFVLEYSIKRNNDVRTGRIMIATNGTVSSDSDDFTEVGLTGVIFDTIVSGVNINLRYTSTNTGFAGTFECATRKWP